MTDQPVNLRINTGIRSTETHEQRFQRYVQRTDDPNDCWLWTGGTNRKHGYGAFAIRDHFGRRRPPVLAHRFAYHLEYGPIPNGYEIHHDCEQKLCVNPRHLVLVTRAQHAKLGRNATKTHCVHGHPYTDENTYRNASGQRACRTCRNEGARARRRRQAVTKFTWTQP